MKKLNTIYHVIIIGMMGYLGIANHLLVEKIRDVEQQSMAGMMMGNDANMKIETLIELLESDFNNEVRRAVRDILKEGVKQTEEGIDQ